STDLLPSTSDALTVLAAKSSSPLIKTWVERTLKGTLSPILTRSAAGLMMNSWACDDTVKITQQAKADKLYFAIKAFIFFLASNLKITRGLSSQSFPLLFSTDLPACN